MNKSAEKYFLWIFFAAAAVIMLASRWLPHPHNFTAAGGFLFVSGLLAVRSKWFFAAPFAVIGISDLLLGGYPGISFVYLGHLSVLGFGLYFARGWAQSSRGARSLSFVVLSMSSAVAFFVLSNIGVWWSSGIYERTAAGLAQCFVMSLPFFHQTVLSHLVYGALFVLAYQWLRPRVLISEPSVERVRS